MAQGKLYPGHCRGREDNEEEAFVKAVEEAIKKNVKNGHPIARYDANEKKPYLEYPDGKRIYSD